MKKEELDQIEDLADKLVTAVGAREQAPQLTAEAIRDRQAAFTLFINAYDEVRSVIGFLRRKQGDVDTIAPSLFIGRAVAKKKPSAVGALGRSRWGKGSRRQYGAGHQAFRGAKAGSCGRRHRRTRASKVL